MKDNALAITHQIIIPAPLDAVWAFLMNESHMQRWFEADDFEINVYEGGNIEIPLVIAGEDTFIEGEMGLILPKKRYAFTWNERDKYGHTWFNTTIVTIKLEEVNNETKLELLHDGIKYLPEDIQVDIYEKYRSFWKEGDILHRLKDLIVEQWTAESNGVGGE